MRCFPGGRACFCRSQQSLKGLYNELTPDVEAQVAAIEQEKARLNQSLDYVRDELEKVDVSDQLGENLEATRAALERAKAQVRVCADRSHDSSSSDADK